MCEPMLHAAVSEVSAHHLSWSDTMTGWHSDRLRQTCFAPQNIKRMLYSRTWLKRKVLTRSEHVTRDWGCLDGGESLGSRARHPAPTSEPGLAYVPARAGQCTRRPGRGRGRVLESTLRTELSGPARPPAPGPAARRSLDLETLSKAALLIKWGSQSQTSELYFQFTFYSQ